MMSTEPLRIGTLGAARITPMALVRPAREVAGVEVVAVAARDRARAENFARKHRIPRVCASYDELVADPEINAIYNPLPNSHHCEWTLRALEAGKHVLCEKPLAANAAEAEHMAEAAEKAGRVLVEAFHYRYHPLAARMQEIVESGELGEIRHVEASMCFPLARPGDIRFRLELAGGATMDAGCYPINLVRFLAGAEPEVVSAEARLASRGVDRWMRAELRFPDGRSGRVTASLFGWPPLRIDARVRGEAGELRVLNPFVPQLFHRLTLRTPSESRSERVRGDASYTHQLRAFVSMLGGGPPMATDARDGIANMRTVDAVYRAANLTPRGN